MIEFAATAAPTLDIAPAEYQRLLGYPPDFVLDGRASELAQAARSWYEEHGRPWAYARQANTLELSDNLIRIDGVPFVSERLHATLRQAEAESAIVVAVSAGPELERQAQLLWESEKPDEYFFLEVYGSAVVEHLLTMKGAELCAWADSRDEAVLPHYSPGYPEWDVAQQPQLLELIRLSGRQRLPGDLAALDSGMLRPKKSLLAVFGITRQRDRVTRLTDLNPCESCSYLACQYRRRPYLRASSGPDFDTTEITKQVFAQILPAAVALESNARYSVSVKALTRWATDRLALTHRDNGVIDALFRYEGTTCSNLGRPLLFDYRVTLGPREDGYIITALSCAPAPGDMGYQSMCRYLDRPDDLMSSIEREKPLLGEPLKSVLSWDSLQSNAGCHCERNDRLRKWQLVFETIHFALLGLERNQERPAGLLAE